MELFVKIILKNIHKLMKRIYLYMKKYFPAFKEIPKEKFWTSSFLINFIFNLYF